MRYFSDILFHKKYFSFQIFSKINFLGYFEKMQLFEEKAAMALFWGNFLENLGKFLFLNYGHTSCRVWR